KRRRPDHAGECAQLGVVLPDRFVVIAPRDGDAVFRSLKLRLQRQEVLVRLQVGIVFGDRQQPPQNAGKLILRRLVFLERFRIGDGGGIHFHLRGARARLHHVGQNGAFLLRVTLHGRHEVGDQVGAALILILHVTPRRLHLLILGGNRVDAAAREKNRHRQDKQKASPAAN